MKNIKMKKRKLMLAYEIVTIESMAKEMKTVNEKEKGKKRKEIL
jgi:hypothetical protein